MYLKCIIDTVGQSERVVDNLQTNSYNIGRLLGKIREN